MIFLLMGLAYQHVGPLPGPTRRSPRDQVGLHGRMGLTRTRSGTVLAMALGSLRPARSFAGRRQDHCLESKYFDVCFIWADPASTCGLPATAAPINRSATGLPIGMQIIGPYLEDRTTIAFAELLEREFGGFVPPP